MQFHPDLLARLLDEITTQKSDRGYFLIDNIPRTQTFTINTASDLLTLTGTAPNTPWVDSCRVRVTSTGALPGVSGEEVSPTKDYYLKKFTSTTCYLYPRLADGGWIDTDYPIIDFTTVGSGTLRLTEPPFDARDSLAAIFSREMVHPQYARLQEVQIADATLVGDRVARGTTYFEITLGVGQPTFTAGYVGLYNYGEGQELEFIRQISPAFTVVADDSKVLTIAIAAV